MSEKQVAIPMLRWSPPLHGIGTGFLVRFMGRLSLVTAAHVVCGKKPTVEFDDWPSLIEVIVDKERIALPLFVDQKPLFRWKANDDGQTLQDAVALSSAEVDSLAHRFQVFDLDTPVGVQTGDTICAYGYPNVGNSWPPTLHVASGTVVPFAGVMLHTSMGLAPAFSGGPALSADKRLLGMSVGVTNNGATGQVIPAWVLMMLCAQSNTG